MVPTRVPLMDGTDNETGLSYGNQTGPRQVPLVDGTNNVTGLNYENQMGPKRVSLMDGTHMVSVMESKEDQDGSHLCMGPIMRLVSVPPIELK